MYILGINGSPRVGGNTDILLDKVLEGARSEGAEVEKIILNRLRMSGCQECENMRDDGGCIVEDDMQDVFVRIKKADVVILASPIFFGSVSAQTKMMIDRFQCLWRARYIIKDKACQYKKKIGAFISVEASDRADFFKNAKAIVKNLFITINADYKHELFCTGIDAKAKILEHPALLNKAFKLGKRIVCEQL